MSRTSLPRSLRRGAVPLMLSAALAAAWAGPTVASSHREAPFVATQPQVDATDFYMFRSYEPGRDGYVTLVANYLPLQDPYGGPNYFKLDPNAVYEIHVTNDGGAVENLTFQFRFQTTQRRQQVQRRRQDGVDPARAERQRATWRRPTRRRSTCTRRTRST